MANEPQKSAQERALDARMAELDAKLAAMQELEARMKASAPQSGGGIDASQLESILTRVTEAAAAPSNLLASKLKPENVDHLHRGPFEHPKGGIEMPKPALLRDETYCFGTRVRLDDINYPEALAVNELHASLARSQRRVCHEGKWIAQVSDDNNRLTISIPVKTIDDRQDLPPFIQIIQELTNGERALNAGELASEVAMLKAQVAELAGARA